MKKLLILGSLFLLLLLVGCINQTFYVEDSVNESQNQNFSNITKISQTVTEKLIETNNIEKNIIEKVANDNFTSSLQYDEEVKNLIDKGISKKENYVYQYIEGSKSPIKIYYKDGKMLIIPNNNLEYDKKGFNYLFLDRNKKTAEGYCRSIEGIKCKKGYGPFILNFNKWNLPTPQDWIKKTNNGKYYAFSSDGGRPVMVIHEVINETTYEVWLDNFYGVTLQIIGPEKKMSFQNIVYGTVNEDKVNPSDFYAVKIE